jgi:hypothetical protein
MTGPTRDRLVKVTDGWAVRISVIEFPGVEGAHLHLAEHKAHQCRGGKVRWSPTTSGTTIPLDLAREVIREAEALIADVEAAAAAGGSP